MTLKEFIEKLDISLWETMKVKDLVDNSITTIIKADCMWFTETFNVVKIYKDIVEVDYENTL